MRNFFIFLRRFSNQLLFWALVVTCLVLIARTNHLQGNALLNSSNALAGVVYQKQQDVVQYFRLRELNDSLLHENERLRNALITKQTFDTLQQFTRNDTSSYVDKADTTKKIIQYTNYTYRSATVVNNAVQAENNYITINRGSEDGVVPNMAVVSGTGVVGKVIRTSAHYAVVLSVLSVLQPVSSKLKDGTTGLVKWESKRPYILQMRNVPSETKVKIGDTVVTTNYSFFPANVPVGRVQQVMKSKKTGMKVLFLQPFTNFRKVQYVYAIENKGYSEQKALEDSVKVKP